MSPVAVTTNTRLTLVKHLASGKSLDAVAAIVSLSRETVLDIASHHGYPKTDSLAKAAKMLAAKVDAENTAGAVTEGSAIPARVGPSLIKARQQFADLPDTGPTPKPLGDALATLINEGKAHPAKRIQAAANKVLDDIARLRTLIAEDAEKNAERRKAETEKKAARAEVQKLEAQLREAKAKLRGSTPTAAPSGDGPSAKEVRAWAAETGVECTATGRVPQSVRDAYDAAHQAVAP